MAAPATVEDFVFEQTVRGLDRQAVVLGELRQRASIVLSATGIVASLLGSQALRHPHPAGLAYAGLAITAVSILLCVWVLKSVRDTGRGREWRVTMGADELREILSGGRSMADALTELIDARSTNFDTIAFRSKLFVTACALLPLQIIAWALVQLL